jgi:(4S)-4-hydroxy-5-phosphonooxypentane-2,3-dione isomerase
MLALAVTWVAKPGQEERAVQLFRQLADVSRKEPGCAMFSVHRGNDNPSQFFIYEQYRDQAALDSHRDQPHYKNIARGSLLECADRKEGVLYTLVDG